MFNVLRLFLLLLIAIPSLPAQTTATDQSSELVTTPEGDKFLRWYGHTGKSYFVQISDANNPLAKWFWAPIIEAGNDEEISHEVDGTSPKAFFRLKYTDQVPGPNETLETADFDGDGISNIEEIDPPSPLAATDPSTRTPTTTAWATAGSALMRASCSPWALLRNIGQPTGPRSCPEIWMPSPSFSPAA